MPVVEKYLRRNESAFSSQTEDRGIGYSRKLDVVIATKNVTEEVKNGGK